MSLPPKRELPSKVAHEVVHTWLQDKGLRTSELVRFVIGAMLYEREQCARECEAVGDHRSAALIRARPGTVDRHSLVLPAPLVT